MPKVVLTYDTDQCEYFVDPAVKGVEYDPEYQVVMDMKSSHFRNIRRNEERYWNDRGSIRKLFIEAQMRGRETREQ